MIFLKPLTLLLSIIFILSGVKAAYSQDVVARVDVNFGQISTTEYDYLNELRPLIERYINEHEWTDDTFREEERIEIQFSITLLEVDGSANFDANVVVQSFRPIFNTVVRTPLFRTQDSNWRFNFTRSRNLVYDEFQYDDIASLIDFYVNVALAYDYDSFSELGGTRYLQRAQNVVNVAQSSGAGSAWTGSGARRTRYHLITQLTNSGYEPLRKFNYRYHRHGLDLFTINSDRARQNIFEALETLQDAKRQTTERFLFDILFSTKHREFTAAFLEADTGKRLEAFNLLADLDSSYLSEFEKLQ